MIGSIFREMLNVSSLLLEPWTTKGFTISASVRIYKIQELKKHHDKNHSSDPPPPKVAKKFKCEGCDKEEPSNWHYVRHISTCIHYKALQPRICGVITNKSMMKVANQHNISEATACSIMRSLGKENPTLLFTL